MKFGVSEVLVHACPPKPSSAYIVTDHPAGTRTEDAQLSCTPAACSWARV
jgi:hypothetical protein